MKTLFGYPCTGMAVVMLVIVAVLFAGCNSQPASPPASQPAAVAATVTSSGPVTVSLPYGVSITVPATWTREDVMTSGVKDYNRTAITIARFSSPGDAASRNTLTVDVDKTPGGDFEAYFNKATLDLEKTYGTQLDSHSIVKNSMLQVSGYKSYELDFQTAEVKGSYIFTSTEKGMYVFAFKGPNNRVPVQTLEGQITDIIKSIRITPSDK
jgi:hypothetical protein